MSDARHRCALLFDRDGYGAHHTDDVVEAGVPTNDTGFLSAPKQALPFRANRITARCPVLDNSP